VRPDSGPLAGHGRIFSPVFMRSRFNSSERVLLELAAHDLRNPLSGVLSATQLLIEEARPVLNSDQLVLLRSIESSTQFMLRLVDDMVELPRFVAGDRKLERHSVEIGLLVEHVVGVNRPLAESRRIKLEVEVQRPEAKLSADPVKLVRALEALLTSSIRSTDAGGKIELLVEEESGRVAITLRHVAAGQSNVALRSLFDPSITTRTRRRFSEERAALMLAYARGIVEAHRGTVALNAGPKGTSSVVISLPISGRAKLQVRAKPAPRKDRKLSAGN
jgi:signal transduction histidine kinase